jgi:Tfp pilus assembly protein PilX
MINTFRNPEDKNRPCHVAEPVKKQLGAAALILTTILMVAAVLIMIYAANFSMLQQKSSTNQKSNNQAFEAAQAGLQFGLVYLTKNASAIIATKSGGFINYGPSDTNLTNVTLANGSKFSVVYTNPTANNYDLIQITSTGTASDGTGTHTVQELAQSVSGASLPGTITTQSNVVASGNVSVTGNYAVDAGGSISTSGHVNFSSTNPNDTNLTNMSADDLFTAITGVSKTTMQAQSTYYPNSSGVNYSNLSGNVWINSSVSLAGNTTVGSAANPVLLVVNGNFSGSGTVAFYGLLYVTGTTSLSGTFDLHGGLISEGQITMSGTAATYDSGILKKVLTGTGTYAKVPGSWKDF